MALADREADFEKLTERFSCERITPLIAAHRIDPVYFERLRIASALYLSKCMPDQKPVSLELLGRGEELLQEFARQQALAKNLTPNGIVVPKKNLILEHNLFIQAFADIIDQLNIGDFIEAWIAPPSLRFKEGLPSEEKLERKFASEHPHSESWIPLNTNQCVTVFIPILGDVEKNWVNFFTPPPDPIFDENWLTPKGSYKEGGEIVERYRPLTIPPEFGMLYLAEVATLHVTSRKPGAGPRASIDVSFKFNRSVGERFTDVLPESQRPKQQTLSEVGRRKLFVYFDGMDEFVPSEGGVRHSSDNRDVVTIVN